MKVLRFIGYGFLTFVLIATVGLGISLWVYRDIPATELEAKYAGPALRFLHFEGVRIHYRDEGAGPVVVLLHANFANLIDWDPWVRALEDSYRVIRLDMTGHGLTGPDPTGDYTAERTLEIVEKFIAAMNLDHFSIGGASMGGTIAIRYTHRHPEHVDNLILLSPDSLESEERNSGPRGEVSYSTYAATYITPRALPAFKLRSGFGDDSRLTDNMIDRWHDMWMREGNRKAQLDRLQQYRSGNIEAIVREIRVPTLLMWGEADTRANYGPAAEFRRLLENVESLTFRSYPGVGHLAVQEAGEATGRDVRAFLEKRGRTAISRKEDVID